MEEPAAGSPAQQFEQLVQAFGTRSGVTGPGGDRRRFGSSALKINGSIFAMLSRDELVVKLPKARVNELLSEGAGGPFDAGKGSPMKEWVVVADSDLNTWRALAEEALAFVGRSAAGLGPDSRRIGR